MALYSYDRGALFINGSCAQEWQEGSVEFVGMHEPVTTMAQGGSIRGFIRSDAQGMNATFTLRIRSDGTEWQDYVDHVMNAEAVALSVWIGGVQFIAEGVLDLTSTDMKAGTAEFSFKGAKPDVY